MGGYWIDSVSQAINTLWSEETTLSLRIYKLFINLLAAVHWISIGIIHIPDAKAEIHQSRSGYKAAYKCTVAVIKSCTPHATKMKIAGHMSLTLCSM